MARAGYVCQLCAVTLVHLPVAYESRCIGCSQLVAVFVETLSRYVGVPHRHAGHHALHAAAAHGQLAVARRSIYHLILEDIGCVGIIGCGVEHRQLALSVVVGLLLVGQGHVEPLVLRQLLDGVRRVILVAYADAHQSAVVRRQRQLVVLSAYADYLAVALAIEPHVEGEATTTQVEHRLRLHAVAVQLQRHVRIGPSLVGHHVVHAAVYAEVAALREGYGVQCLVQPQVHVVAVQPRQQAVLRAYHAEDLRPAGVLEHLHLLRFVGHLFAAVHAEGLCLQLVESILGKLHGGGDDGRVGQRCLAAGGVHPPFLGQRPCVGTLLAVAHAHACQPLVLPVKVAQGDDDAVVLLVALLVEQGVVDGYVDHGRRGYEVYVEHHGVAHRRGVAGGAEPQLYVLIVPDGAVALRDDELLGEQLAALQLHRASLSAVAQRRAVDEELCTVGVAGFNRHQFVGAGGVGLAGVVELQVEPGLPARRHIGDGGGTVYAQLRLLHAHGGLVQLRAWLVVLGVGGALVGLAGLSAACAEDGSPSALRLIDVDGESRRRLGIAEGPVDGRRPDGVFLLRGARAPLPVQVYNGIAADVVDQHSMVCLAVYGAQLLLRLVGAVRRRVAVAAVHARSSGYAVVAFEQVLAGKGGELVLLVLCQPVFPAADLVDAPLHAVGGIVEGIALQSVHDAVAGESISGGYLLAGPEGAVAVGLAPSGVALVVAGVVHQLAGHLHGLCGVVGVVHVYEEVVDQEFPVGNEYVLDVLVRIDEGGGELLAGAYALPLFQQEGAVALAE